MAKELTTIALEKSKPGDKRREIPDGRIGGLYFIIQPNGKRSWAVRYRLGGRPCKFTIGPYPAIDLKTARERAGAAKDKASEGIAPGAERKAFRTAVVAPANDLVEVAAERFLAQYVRRNLKPATISQVEHILINEIISGWHGRRLSQIGRADIHNLLDSIVERGSPITANRTLSWFRRLCSWAIERGLIDVNPCTGVKRPAAETARDRVLSDEELKGLWRASEELEQPYAQFVRLLILTGQRKSEVSGMTWREIDLDRRVWTLPAARAKNKREHEIPLSDLAVEILDGLPRIDGSQFVFTLHGRNPISAFVLTKQRIDAFMPPDTAAWVLHDVRRTVASGMARLGINLPVIEKLLNHVSGSFAGIVGVYQRHSFADEKRAAMATWANFVQALVSDTPPNVVPIRNVQ